MLKLSHATSLQRVIESAEPNVIEFIGNILSDTTFSHSCNRYCSNVNAVNSSMTTK